MIDGILFGIGGGALGELMKWWDIRKDIKEYGIPNWPKSWLYWVITILMIGAGGFMVFVYTKSGAQLTPLVALHIGASTPLIISGIVGESPAISRGGVD